MLEKILGIDMKDWGIFKEIPGNVAEDSGECSSRFQGMFGKILGNVQADSEECSKRFR